MTKSFSFSKPDITVFSNFQNNFLKLEIRHLYIEYSIFKLLRQSTIGSRFIRGVIKLAQFDIGLRWAQRQLDNKI